MVFSSNKHFVFHNLRGYKSASMDEEDDEEDEEENSQSLEIEEGDQVFIMVIHPETHHIQATRNISQRLAEAYH